MERHELHAAARKDPSLNHRKYLLATSDGTFYPDHDISKVQEIAHAHKLEVFELNPQDEKAKETTEQTPEDDE